MKLQELEELVESISCDPFILQVTTGTYGFMLVTRLPITDVFTGDKGESAMNCALGPRMLAEMDKRQVVDFIYMNLKKHWLHELDEHFAVDGVAVHYPHEHKDPVRIKVKKKESPWRSLMQP